MKERFYPFAEECGFVRGKTSSMFVPFRRVRGNKVEVFDVQWDKYNKPRFVLNFGEAPLTGNEIRGKHISAEDLVACDCSPNGRLQRWRGGSLRTWFQMRKPLFETIMTFSFNYTPEEVVSQVTTAFSELENWWESKKEGSHVYI